MSTIDAHARADAAVRLQAGLAVGGIAAVRALGPSIVPRGRGTTAAIAGISFGLGAAAGSQTERLVQAVDHHTPLGSWGSHALVGTAGVATALAARGLGRGGLAAAAAQTAGSVVAISAASGAIVGSLHRHVGAGEQQPAGDGDPGLPWKGIAVGTAVAGATLLGVRVAPRLARAARNAKKLAAGGPAADRAGAALGEVIPRSRIGLPGRIFLEGRIEDLPSRAVRTYVPLSLAGTTSVHERNAIAVESLVRQGAFDKSRIVIGSSTGSGGFNTVPPEIDEILSGGDTAWIVTQYSNKPSIFSLHRTDEGTDTFVDLARQIAAKRRELFPDGGGPDIYAAATSLGALTIQRALVHHGPELLNEVGIRRIMLVGSPERLTQFRPEAFAPGVVGRFHDLDEIRRLTPQQLERMRVLEFAHETDPVRLMDFRIGLQRPAFLTTGGRLDAIDPRQRWTPGVTLLHHAGDVAASVSRAASDRITSSWHDYRHDLPVVVRAAFGHSGVSDARLAEVGAVVEARNVERIRAMRKLLGMG